MGVVAPVITRSRAKIGRVPAARKKNQPTAETASENTITPLRPNLSAMAPPRKVVTIPTAAFSVISQATPESGSPRRWLMYSRRYGHIRL